MDKIFIDTDALVALNNLSDKLHNRALEAAKKINGKSYQYYIGLNILMETLTIVSQRCGKKQANALLKELRSENYIVLNPSQEEILIAEEIFANARSKNLSYSDCISFAVMKTHNISQAFSFDIHFKKHGFKRISIDK
ncbi:MAG: PIN domain-containing protein [Patescibacteria group bacterium]|nr:PIN domain-containing protein [Patescibacteria group bacterium]